MLNPEMRFKTFAAAGRETDQREISQLFQTFQVRNSWETKTKCVCQVQGKWSVVLIEVAVFGVIALCIVHV